MQIKTKTYLSLFLYLVTTILINPDLTAQETLTPGRIYSLSDYELTLNERYWDIFDKSEYRTGVIFRPAWGREWISGIRKDSSGYSLYTMEADTTGWYRRYWQEPCDSEYVIVMIQKEGEKPVCGEKDFDKLGMDTTHTAIFTREISGDLGHLLIKVWGEMIARSRYTPDEFIMLSHGYGYEFFSKDLEYGAYAHIQSPYEGTTTYSFIEMMWDIYNFSTAKEDSKADSLKEQLTLRSRQLISTILEGGAEVPYRNRENRMLKACSPDILEVSDSEYCWEIDNIFTDDRYFLTSQSVNDKYEFSVHTLRSGKVINSIRVVPVDVKDYPARTIEEVKSGTTIYYLLQPWDISEINTLTFTGQLMIYVYRNYKAEVFPEYLPEGVVIVEFDGVGTSKHNNTSLFFKGKREWITMDELFQN